MANALATPKPTESHQIPAGVQVGAGLPPVPGKLAERITRWEYVDMADVVAVLWPLPNVPEGTSSKPRRQIQDINLWLQCFATFITVMASKFPEYTPQLLAYMVTILKASQEYEGAAWAAYDVAYRQQAAATGHKRWSEVNTSLYAVCFTGKGKRALRCEACLSAGHRTMDCPAKAEAEPCLADRIKLVEAAVLGSNQSTRYTRSPEICNKFNMKKCTYRMCKYRHVCRTCGRNHPALECPQHGQRPLGGGPIRREADKNYSHPY